MTNREGPPRPIKRLLVANRGEIARRVFRTARRLGIDTVAVYSEPDRFAAHVADADIAAALGGATSAESYLRIDKILDAARRAGADAVHPGYGFLAENPDFAEAVLAAGITWVGPSPKNIREMAGKIEAKAIAASAGVPLIPGATLPESDTDEAIAAAADGVGYPLLVKASAGGGGKGMRLVVGPDEILEAIAGARREAAAAFGDGTVFLERYLAGAHHVEVQVFGDEHGDVVHLFERECSIQRRHQKIVEECPSPTATAATATRMCEAAVALAKAIGYVGAGTVEFLVAGSVATQEFFFLEMNTRLQVEHPVTEEVVDPAVDLVEWQLHVAQGGRLPRAQADIRQHGHAIEARLYAEDPARDFLPCSGTLLAFDAPSGGGDLRRPEAVRRSSAREEIGYVSGQEVSPLYDPMIAKLVAWGENRQQAAESLAADLAARDIVGITTNRDSLVAILRSDAFVAGDTPTDFLDRHPEVLAPPADPHTSARHLVAATIVAAEKARAAAGWGRLAWPGWRNVPAVPQRADWAVGDGPHAAAQSVLINWSAIDAGQVAVVDADDTAGRTGPLPDPDRFRYRITDTPGSACRIDLELAGVTHHYSVDARAEWWWTNDGIHSLSFLQIPRFGAGHEAAEAGGLAAPVPGTVVAVAVTLDDHVEAGQTLVVLEAMKMEHRIKAPMPGRVAEVRVQPGQAVDAHQLLVVIETEGDEE